MNPDDLEEKKHFFKIINAFKSYRYHSFKNIQKSLSNFANLPDAHKILMPYFVSNLKKQQICIESNYQIIKLIIENVEEMFEDTKMNLDGLIKEEKLCPVSEFDMDKIRSTLKQFVRDWTEEGRLERDACYSPIIQQIKQLFPVEKFSPNSINILVPGAGLGRLVFELANLGYNSEGNEFSLFMLFASNFVLNRCKEAREYALYPWVHQSSNNLSPTDRLRQVRFPDVTPTSIKPDVRFSMMAGDFLEIYQQNDIFDCVATVFFIDTAHNIAAYVETIFKVLKPGGYWINFGPLLYHFADMTNEPSIELSYDELKHIIKEMKFHFIHEELNCPATYTQDQKSMLQYQYRCVYFVVQKPKS